MSKVKNLMAGLGGAIALNVLHESLKRFNNTPRIDHLGEEAIQKGLHHVGVDVKNKEDLYGVTLTGDLISNALYYSMIGAGDPKYIWHKAIGLGLAAGTGAIELPAPMGLNPDPVARNKKVMALTIGYYLAGALVTAGIVTALNKGRRY